MLYFIHTLQLALNQGCTAMVYHGRFPAINKFHHQASAQK